MEREESSAIGLWPLGFVEFYPDLSIPKLQLCTIFLGSSLTLKVSVEDFNISDYCFPGDIFESGVRD